MALDGEACYNDKPMPATAIDPQVLKLVYAEPSVSLNGAVRFQSLDPRLASTGMLDQYDTLRNWSQLEEFERAIADMGLQFQYVGDAADYLDFLRDLVTKPFQVESEFLRDRQLYRFQHVGMNLAYAVDRVLVQWDTGCLAGDARVGVCWNGKHRPIPISEVIEKHRDWPDMQVRRAQDGCIRLAPLARALESGVQYTYELTTESGRSIRATAGHEFATDDGWAQLGQLAAGDAIQVDIGQGGESRSPKLYYRYTMGMHNHPYATVGTHPRYDRPGAPPRVQARVATHRLVAEAELNGLELESYIAAIRGGDVGGLAFLDPQRWEVHHRDHCTTNNHPRNLEVLEMGEHQHRHGVETHWRNVAHKVGYDRIASIRPYGEELTYDLTVADDPHNYVANGFVVHNSGKTVLGTLVTQKLFDDGLVDLCIVLCKRAKKIDWEDFFRDYTSLNVVRPPDDRKKRHKVYKELADPTPTSDGSTESGCTCRGNVVILNYEKARYPTKFKRGPHRGQFDFGQTDLWELLQLVEGRKVLFVLDEAQKIGSGDSLVSKGLRGLINPTPGSKGAPESTRCIALTATPYSTSPYNIRNIFGTLVPDLPMVSCLGNKDEFDREYVAEKVSIQTSPYTSREWVKRWNESALPKLGKRIERHTTVAMKSDPVIAAQFPQMTEREIRLEMSSADRRVYDAILDIAKEKFDDQSMMANLANFQLLRMVCDTTESLRYSQSEVAAEVLQLKLQFETKNSTKYEAVEGLCDTILEADDKIVLFSFWANAVMRPYLHHLRKAFPDAPIFSYAGTTMSEEEQDRNKREFNAVRGGAVLVMSDAGQEGLNLYAPYLAHIELPYTFSSYKQRRDRIHRSDSKSHGIDHVWIYRFLMGDTVEQRVSDKVFLRKRHAELIQGTPDVITTDDGGEDERMSMSVIREMMFGGD